jgi:DNA-binding PadR family transcriptional regulator
MTNRSVTLLALLAADDRLGQPEVHRTVLVKQAFLAETIRPLYGQWLRTFPFVRYFYGPYSADVFLCLDTLIFNGLVEVTTAVRRGGRVEARYRITPAGHVVLGQIEAGEITSLATDLVWALQTLGVDRVSAISKLVYQEAEFARIFAQHTETGIGPENKVPLPSITSANNETFVTLATLRELQQQRTRGKQDAETFTLPSREVVRVFLESLARQVPRGRADERAA